jgi:AcrR family transcriptional regulator
MAEEQRQKLLEGAIEYVASSGLTELSLRSLAAELGTSHRMLIHHFGSKEALWVAIIHEVEARQRSALADVLPDPSEPFDVAMRAWWRHISEPKLWPNERLFFEVYAQALRGREPSVRLLDGIVDDWVAPIAAMAQDLGFSRRDARAYARLCIAVTRGLLLDLLATRDRKAVDAAMDQFIALGQLSFRSLRS